MHNLKKIKICPICDSDKETTYLGISYVGTHLEKLFVCKNRYKHRENKYVYYVAKVRTEIPHKKSQDKEGQKDKPLTHNEKSKKRTEINDKYESVIVIKDEQRFTIKLSQRVMCPKYQEHEDQTENTEFKYVNVKGNENRFYCRGHQIKKHNVYEFRYTPVKTTYRLKDLLEQISEHLLKRLRKIHDSKQVYDVKIDKEGLVDYLLSIKLSTYIIARLFHTTQNKIYNIKKKREEQYIAAVRKVNSDPSTKSKNSSVFMLQVELTNEDYVRITLEKNYKPTSKKK